MNHSSRHELPSKCRACLVELHRLRELNQHAGLQHQAQQSLLDQPPALDGSLQGLLRVIAEALSECDVSAQILSKS